MLIMLRLLIITVFVAEAEREASDSTGVICLLGDKKAKKRDEKRSYPAADRIFFTLRML